MHDRETMEKRLMNSFYSFNLLFFYLLQIDQKTSVYSVHDILFLDTILLYQLFQ